MKRIICFTFLLISLIFTTQSRANPDNAILLIYTNIGSRTNSAGITVEPSNFAIKIPFGSMKKCNQAKIKFERDNSYAWKAVCFDNTF